MKAHIFDDEIPVSGGEEAVPGSVLFRGVLPPSRFLRIRILVRLEWKAHFENPSSGSSANPVVDVPPSGIELRVRLRKASGSNFVDWQGITRKVVQLPGMQLFSLARREFPESGIGAFEEELSTLRPSEVTEVVIEGRFTHEYSVINHLAYRGGLTCKGVFWEELPYTAGTEVPVAPVIT